MQRLIGIATAALLCANAAWAGQIVLKNGDVVTGEIKYFDGDDYVIENDYIDGEFKVAADQVAEIKSDVLMDVQYKDGELVTGRLATEDGKVVIVPEDGGSVPLDVSRLDEVGQVEEYFEYNADVHIGISGASGNTENELFHADASFEPRWGDNRFRLYGQLNEGSATVRETDENGEQREIENTTESNWRLLLQYNRDLDYRWYLFAANQWDSDKLLRLNVRTSISGGAGYKIWQEGYRDWWIELGPAYVHENWKNPTADEDFVALRWALNFEHDIYSDDFRFYHRHNILESLQELERFIFQSTTGIKFEIYEDLVGGLEIQFDWNNEPANDAGEDDLRYMFKLGYEFSS